MSALVGYGVNLSFNKIKWRKDAKNILVGIIKEKCPVLKEEYEDALSCNVPDNYDTEEEFINDFVDEFVEGLSCTSGLEGLVLAVIREISNDDAYGCDDVCIYYPAFIPMNAKERASCTTCEDIDKVLADVLNPLLEQPVSTEWLDVYLG